MLRSASVTAPSTSRRFVAAAIVAALIGAVVMLTGGAPRAFADDTLASVSGSLSGGGAAVIGAEVDI